MDARVRTVSIYQSAVLRSTKIQAIQNRSLIHSFLVIIALTALITGVTYTHTIYFANRSLARDIFKSSSFMNRAKLIRRGTRVNVDKKF